MELRQHREHDVVGGELGDTSARLFQKQFAWVRTTPLGAASLPEV
jgi:hypothetical protein